MMQFYGRRRTHSNNTSRGVRDIPRYASLPSPILPHCPLPLSGELHPHALSTAA